MKTRVVRILAVVTISIAILLLGGVYLVNKVFDLVITSQINELDINEGIEKTSLNNPVTTNSSKITQRQEIIDNKYDDSDNSDITVETSNHEGRDANTINEGEQGTSIKEGQEASNKEGQEASNKEGQEASNKEDQEASNKEDQETSNEKSLEAIKETINEEGDAVITNKNIKELEGKVTLSDKAKALQIVSSRLKAEDISILKEMIKNGITSSEIESAKKILKSRITEDEKNYLKELVNKYEVLP
jgi:hypothetical protein